ncbi:MAG: polymerase sigma-70 factor, subfamily [Acidimicrobiaceae bacterium]
MSSRGPDRQRVVTQATALRCPTVATRSDTGKTRPRPGAIELELETHRRELTGYCYRMLGSGFEAEDAVQETMVRAWRAIDSFEGRSSLRSWLYRIATNVCLDMARGPQRRARPMDMSPSSTADSALGPLLPENTWIQPVPDGWVLPEGDPADVAASRETIRLAFVAALQHLPPRQRAVLILREVLKWQASEVAELLDTTVVSVNSALQRARATLSAADIDATSASAVDADQQELLARYVDAFERYDIESLVALLHEDATFSMPPFELWLQGTVEIGKWYLGQGIGCRDGRLLATSANGCAAFGAYKQAEPGVLLPFSLQVIEVSGDRISGLHHFLYPDLFPVFGLPTRLER